MASANLENYIHSNIITAELIRVMSLDNGVVFKPFLSQILQLKDAVLSLIEEGLGFSDEDIFQITSGEESEVQSAYGKLRGFQTLQGILVSIFDGPIES